MKIGIAGAGMAGAWLARRCDQHGMSVQLFDHTDKVRCGITSCAWGFTKVNTARLLSLVGLNINDFVLAQPSKLESKKWAGKVNSLVILDKPALINSLVDGTPVSYESPEPSEFDYFVDATGKARAFLPPINDDQISTTVQSRCRTDLDSAGIYATSGGDPQSYVWAFPLGNGEWHVGYGDKMPMGALLGFHKGEQLSLNAFGPRHDVGCACKANIRVTGPSAARPFVNEVVWGVGEAIGCVSPLTGEGNAPGMRSAEIFFDNVLTGDATPEQYERMICREFSWMDRERKFSNALSDGRKAACFWHGVLIVARLSIERLRSNAFIDN